MAASHAPVPPCHDGMHPSVSEGSSYKQILRSSSIIGGASVVNILIGLLRTKVVAVVLGTAGLE